MTRIKLSRFERDQGSYTKIGTPYIACIEADGQCPTIGAHMDGLISHLRKFPDEPRGWSFCEWSGSTPKEANFVEAFAIVLDYPLSAVERLRPKVEQLGYSHFWITTEAKRAEKKSIWQNTISLCFPLANSTSFARYSRIASILAYELDEYELFEGSLAATHVIHITPSSIAVVEPAWRGLIDPQAFITATKDDYKNLKAARYHGKRPVQKTLEQITGIPILLPTGMVADDTGLFQFPETADEAVERECFAKTGMLP